MTRRPIRTLRTSRQSAERGPRAGTLPVTSATKKGRCRLHGGASGSGGPPGERNVAFRDGGIGPLDCNRPTGWRDSRGNLQATSAVIRLRHEIDSDQLVDWNGAAHSGTRAKAGAKGHSPD